MALRSGYEGIKKLAAGLKWNRPGVLAADDLALANVFFPRSEQAVLGAKNLLKINAVSKTNNGVSYVVDGDGVLSLNNTATADSYVNLGSIILPAGDYIISGCEDGSLSTYYLDIFSGGSRVVTCTDGDASFKLDAETTLNIYPNVKNGVDASGIKMYPMIRLASDSDSTYVPYAMTNKELTEKVQGIINAATNAADFAAFKTAIGNL